MKIGITCYPVVGGSGIVATELGMHLAAKGHQVHFISYQLPFRLDQFRENVFFHQVDVSSYPLFKYPPYTLSLAAKMADVVCRWKLDLLHVHYAIPHATAAFLAKQISGDCKIKVVTTLHGTDITLVGSERSFFEITKFSVDVSDGITTVSEAIRKQTVEVFDIKKPIEVIPNFVDVEAFKPGVRHCSRRTFAQEDELILMHASNFRPVKRVPDVIEIFSRVRKKLKCKLILVGDGPEMSMAELLIGKNGLNDEVMLLGNQDSIATILPVADLFLLPSQTESFGLSALEAMACGVPVIASNTGGLPELVTHGYDGFLQPVGDVEGMSEAAIGLLGDKGKLNAMKEAARTSAVTRFSSNLMVPRYEDYYMRVIAGRNND